MGLTPIGCSYTLGFVLVEACWWLSEAAPNSKISSLYKPASKTYMPSAACTCAIVNCTTSAIFIHNVLILPDFFRFFVFKIFILKYFDVTLALRPASDHPQSAGQLFTLFPPRLSLIYRVFFYLF